MGIDIFVPDCFLGLGNFYIKRRNMTKEEIIAMAQEAQMPFYWRTGEITYLDKLERFAALVASAEREKVATWMMQCGYATGHGDTIEDLLKELDWQAKEIERSMCVQIVESEAMQYAEPVWAFEIVNDIKTRGQA